MFSSKLRYNKGLKGGNHRYHVHVESWVEEELGNNNNGTE